jgi:hypothetical protein
VTFCVSFGARLSASDSAVQLSIWPLVLQSME